MISSRGSSRAAQKSRGVNIDLPAFVLDEREAVRSSGLFDSLVSSKGTYGGGAAALHAAAEISTKHILQVIAQRNEELLSCQRRASSHVKNMMGLRTRQLYPVSKATERRASFLPHSP